MSSYLFYQNDLFLMKNIKILLLVSLSVFSACQQNQDVNSNPNIIILYADDLGYGDLSSYGGDIPTPHIDRIGQEGIRFTDFHVAGPACTPSRYGLLTGSYPQRSLHGLDKVIMPLGEVHYFDQCEKILPEFLKMQDYHTAVIGKWHLGATEPEHLPMNHGFDLFTGHKGGCIDYFYHVYGEIGNFWFVDGKPAVEEGYSTTLIVDHAIDYIDRVKERQNPFFLYIPFNAPHYGKTDPDSIHDVTLKLDPANNYGGYQVMNSLQAPREYVERFSHIDDQHRQVYSAMVSAMDDEVGRLWSKLESEGLLENTIIWFISDNGGYSERKYGHASNGPLRNEKGSLYEGGIRIPALLSWPNKIEAGQVIDEPLNNTDLVPTLGAITGFNDTLSHFPIDGTDISKVLFENRSIDRGIYWEFRNETAYRKGDWKLYGEDELYNLKEDIYESKNLAEEYPEKFQEMKEALIQIRNSITPYSCN